MKGLKSKLTRPLFLLNLIVFVYLELVFFITLSEHFYIEALLLQPIYLFLFGISLCKTLRIRKWKRKFFTLYFIWLLIFIPLLSITVAIPVHRKNDPEYTFWCSVNDIPTHQEDILLLKEENIGFIISVYELDNESIQNIQNLVEQNISVSLNIGGDSFAYMDNYNSFIETYLIIRELDFFNELESFTIDAEPEHKFAEDLIASNWWEMIPKAISNYPSYEEIVNATHGYQELIDLVHADGKTIGIVKDIEFGVYVDTALRNIYYLKQLKWDFEIYMQYRISLGGGFRRFTDFEMYDFISYYGHEALLGSFKCGYTWEELLTDITICSSLGHENVYLYNYGSFIDKFGIEAITDLKPYDSYMIRYNILNVITQFLFWHGLDWGNIIIGLFQ